MLHGEGNEEGGQLPVEVMPDDKEGQVLQALEEKDIFALAAKVFGNDLIREIIVNHAIHQGGSSLDIPTVCALRTLGIDWNDSVCKLLHKNHLPLYRINVGNESSLNDQRCNEGMAELLDQFSKTFACSFNVLGRTPTFELCLDREAFIRENYNSLYNFLFACGEGLVSVDFSIPRNCGSINRMFPSLKLPSLYKAVFRLHDEILEGEGEIQESDNITHLLQSVFSAATSLKDVLIEQSHPYQSSVFECIVLPPTLTTLDVTLEVDTQDMDRLILRSPLPNLKSLTLSVVVSSVTEGLLSKILEHVRFTLKTLSIYSDYVGAKEPFLFRLPIMEKLEVVEIFTDVVVPESVRNCSLETFLPKLRKVLFENHNYNLIRTWTTGSKFCGVEELVIETEYEHLNLDTETMNRIHLAFPNVTKLVLSLTEFSSAVLQYMFMEMSNLVDLKIRKVDYSGTESITDWNSILIGKPSQFTDALQAVPILWPNVQLNNDEDPSIRKLTDLRRFCLRDENLKEELVIDVSVQFAFMQMPQLEELEFSRVFWVNPEMANKWRVDGGVLNYKT